MGESGIFENMYKCIYETVAEAGVTEEMDETIHSDGGPKTSM
jgi:hypothetical protein